MRRYDCRPDARAGKCGGDAIAVCVSLVSDPHCSQSRIV